MIGSSAQAGQSSTAMTNDDIVRMAKAGLGEDTIVAKIRESKATVKFDTSVDALIKLKEAGVTERVVQAILAPAEPAATAAPAPAGGGSGGDVLDAGFFIEKNGELVRLEPTSVFTRGYSSVFVGRSANVSVLTEQPKFILSLANAVGGLAMTGPAEFVLLKLEQKQDRRELKHRTALSLMGLPFSFEETGARKYTIIPTKPLSPGQYTFYHTGTQKVFDFEIGVDVEAIAAARKRKR